MPKRAKGVLKSANRCGATLDYILLLSLLEISFLNMRDI